MHAPPASNTRLLIQVLHWYVIAGRVPENTVFLWVTQFLDYSQRVNLAGCCPQMGMKETHKPHFLKCAFPHAVQHKSHFCSQLQMCIEVSEIALSINAVLAKHLDAVWDTPCWKLALYFALLGAYVSFQRLHPWLQPWCSQCTQEVSCTNDLCAHQILGHLCAQWGLWNKSEQPEVRSKLCQLLTGLRGC